MRLASSLRIPNQHGVRRGFGSDISQRRRHYCFEPGSRRNLSKPLILKDIPASFAPGFSLPPQRDSRCMSNVRVFQLTPTSILAIRDPNPFKRVMFRRT